jgi:phosphoenolpyruvate carboxykinase (ATP)
MTSSTSIDLSFEPARVRDPGQRVRRRDEEGRVHDHELPDAQAGVLSMHCSATQAKDGDDTSVLFGLSGTGKTTLSADPKRLLIGDDEHCWSDDGVFNIEGGCYAKVIDLSKEQEPDIWNALQFGSVLENVVFDPETTSSTTTTSRSPRTPAAATRSTSSPTPSCPAVAGHPKNVIFLTCDAFGVLPPVSKLTPAQAMYHFISGYTAKVAGTEVGVKDPEATFSACFGGPFLVWHPTKYAELLAEKLRKHHAQTWLVNTGWSGGGHGVGKRMKLSYTRAIIDAIHSAPSTRSRPSRIRSSACSCRPSCPGVPTELLVPKNTWADKAAYDAQAKKVAHLFRDNFKKYEGQASDEIRAAAPRV